MSTGVCDGNTSGLLTELDDKQSAREHATINHRCVTSCVAQVRIIMITIIKTLSVFVVFENKAL